MRIVDRARRAGCLASGVASFALFFAIGFAVSLVSGDLETTIQALVVTLLLAGAAVWLARRHAGARRQ